MKKSMKKLIGLFFLTAILGLTACAEPEKLANEETYQEKSDRYVEMLASMDAETLSAEVAELEENYDDFEQQVALFPYIGGTGQKFDFTAEAYVSLLKAYEANLEDLGAYVGVKEYEGGTEKDGEVTYAVVYEFEKHDMRLSLVYDKDDVVTTVTADPLYSTGEILEKAGLNTLLGMGVVFAVLILISLIISCFGFIPAIEAKFSKKKEAPKKEAVPAPAAAPAAAAPVKNETDDLELVAVITAAVAAAMGTSSDGFVVRSIKRRSSNKWKKA